MVKKPGFLKKDCLMLKDKTSSCIHLNSSYFAPPEVYKLLLWDYKQCLIIWVMTGWVADMF